MRQMRVCTFDGLCVFLTAGSVGQGIRRTEARKEQTLGVHAARDIMQLMGNQGLGHWDNTAQRLFMVVDLPTDPTDPTHAAFDAHLQELCMFPLETYINTVVRAPTAPETRRAAIVHDDTTDNGAGLAASANLHARRRARRACSSCTRRGAKCIRR